MSKSLGILVVLAVLSLLAFSSYAMAQDPLTEIGQILRTDPAIVSVAANIDPYHNLPPNQKQPQKELPPIITVTSPMGGKFCEGESVTIAWNYAGDIGGAVNIKAKNDIIATGVPVQGGHGTYVSRVPSGTPKGTDYNIVVEAGNGKAKGTGGTFWVYNDYNKDCATGKYLGK